MLSWCGVVWTGLLHASSQMHVLAEAKVSPIGKCTVAMVANIRILITMEGIVGDQLNAQESM